MKASRDYTINSVRNALIILKSFKLGNQELSITEIGDMSGMGRSSALRYVYTLLNEGFLEYNSVTEKYRLGIEVYKLGILKYESLDLRKIATKYLQEVADEESMVCYLAIRDGDSIAVVDKVFPSNKPFWAQLTTQVGGVMNLYSTGIGRLYLAMDSDSDIERYLSKSDRFLKLSEHTLVGHDELLREIKSARALGYNVNKGENEEHIYGFCAPILDRTGKMCAGISISGLDQICEIKYNYLCNRIVEIGKRVSYEMGYEE